MRSSIAIGLVCSLRSSSNGHIVYCHFSFLYGDDEDHDDDHADNDDSGDAIEVGNEDDLAIFPLKNMMDTRK